MKNSTRLHCFFTLIFTLFSFNLSLFAQYTPDTEMRGVWVASVLNIDYPSYGTTNENTLQNDWIQIIDKHKALGINALFVQIRPTADAFYPSDIVPWSRYLTGRSGVAPANGFDPLAFMIETAHQRGMAFHAWLNPYRVSMDGQTGASFAPNHVLNAHPDWCMLYNKRYILNPGLPEVRAHITDVVAEIVSKYNVDGVHFDDYFYPYKNGNETIKDYDAFQKYGQGFSNVDDWRRNNVDLMISNLSQTIKSIKPNVQFGISPFGVWRNGYRDPEGSDTRAGLTCYDDLYADVRKWMRENWVDYVIPQIYWTVGFSIADHDKIARWWSDNASGKTIYIGHGAYRVGQGSNREPNWSDPNEIPRQIRLARSLPYVRGSVFFSSKSLIANPLGMSDSLRLNYYRYPAAPPGSNFSINNTSLMACEPPEVRPIMSQAGGKVLIRWQPSQLALRRTPFQYIIYRFADGRVDYTNAHNIIAILPSNGKTEMTFFDAKAGSNNLYAVTVSDCLNNETSPTTVVSMNPPVLPRLDPERAKRKHVSWFKSFWRRAFGK